MTNRFRMIAVTVFAIYAATSVTGSMSFAHGRHHGRGSHSHNHVRPLPAHGHGHHNGPDAGDGFLLGLTAALASIWSSFVTAESNHYEADTLIQAAAAYQLDGTVSPVFAAFAADIAAEMGEQANGVDQDTLHSLIADKIVNEAASAE